MTEFERKIKSVAVVRVVDDDPDLRKSLTLMLRCEGWGVRAYPSAEAFFLDCTRKPGCVIMDIRMNGMSGVEAQQEMIRRHINLPIIFLTGHGDVDIAVETMREGAVDFLQKPVNPDRLLSALTTYAGRSCRLTSGWAANSRAEAQELWDRLTAREKQIVSLSQQGLATSRIAERLGLSIRTIENFRSSICKKLNIQRIDELQQTRWKLLD